jgi:hypothetical protein
MWQHFWGIPQYCHCLHALFLYSSTHLQALRNLQPFWEFLGLATAQRPLLIFFDSIDELTGSQVCDNLSVGATRSCHCSGPPLLIFFDSVNKLTGSQVFDNLSEGAPRSCHCSAPPLLLFFDSMDELTGSQVCDNISEEFLRLATAQHPLLIFFESIHELNGSQV